jgi:hypothetical protein
MRMTIAAIAAVALCACAPAETGSEALEAQARRLEIDTKMALDLDEVSGIAVLPAGDDAATLVAVGDASRRIAAVFADGDPYQLEDFYEGDDEASQWEAVAADGAGSIFVLDESADRIEIFDDAGERTGILTLKLTGELAEIWAAEPNTQGEGLVLLSNATCWWSKNESPRSSSSSADRANRPRAIARSSRSRPTSRSRQAAPRSWRSITGSSTTRSRSARAT